MVAKPIERIDLHKDGSVKAKDCTINGVLTGYWSGSKKTAQKCDLDILKTANRQANGQPMTPKEKPSKSRG
jgi:hypothetical protein